MMYDVVFTFALNYKMNRYFDTARVPVHSLLELFREKLMEIELISTQFYVLSRINRTPGSRCNAAVASP